MNDGKSALPVSLEDGIELSLEMRVNLLNRWQFLSVLLTIHTRNNSGEQNEDVLVLVFEVDLACLGNVVLGISHQITQGVNYDRQDVELFFLSEFHKTVNQYNQYLLSIKISYLLIRMAG